MSGSYRHSLVKTLLAAGLLLTLTDRMAAQTYSVSGTLTGVDQEQTEPLSGANVELIALPDTVRVSGTATGRDGTWQLQEVEPGEYLIRASYLGYEPQQRAVRVEDRDPEDISFQLQATPLRLDELRVTGRRPRVEVSGDTTRFRADGYRTRPDATTEELVSRMPGFLIQDGELQAQGEAVHRVLVDGEEFFGEDAIAVLRNLPAEIIEQVEVFDRRSEQARFTGFDDGSEQRTVNLVTREGMNNGHFGRVNTGYGTETRYLGGGNYNYFDGSQRITLLGMLNNVNQTNFSSEDLLGITEGGGRRGGGGSFRTGGQSGVSSVGSGGINYIDRWNDSWSINASYFFNMTDTESERDLERRYVTGRLSDQLYDEDSRTTNDRYNHRFNMRLEHTIDERRSLVFTPTVSIQQNGQFRTSEGITRDGTEQLLNHIRSETRSDNSSYNLSGNLLYRHRFETRGRTFSASIRPVIRDQSGDRLQQDESLYAGETDLNIMTDRRMETITDRKNWTGNFSFTEPVGDRGQVMVTWQPAYETNRSFQDAFDYDESTGAYTRTDTSLTSRYENRVWTHLGRAGYRFGGDRFNVDLNLGLQHDALDGRQLFPESVESGESWRSLLPGASFLFRAGERSTLNLSYHTSVRIPSARELQDVIDTSDPLRLSTGNPDLDPQYEHQVSLRFRTSDSERVRSTMASVSFGLSDGYIGTRTTVADSDTLLQEGVTLRRGGRLIQTDNIGQAWNLRSMVNRSFPVDLIRSNLNLHTGVSFRQTPSYIDEQANRSNNYGLNAGLTASGNIRTEIDYRLTYRGGYNIVRNSLRPELDNDYFSGRLSGNFDLLPWRGLVVTGETNLRHYHGLGEAFNRNYIFLNGSVGYRFLEDRAAEIRLTVFDILGQNDDINRLVAEDYVEDYRSNVLSRYAMVSFRYNFRTFPGAPQPRSDGPRRGR